MANRTGSGLKREVFSARERAVSDDLVRAQAFLSAAIAEKHRRIHTSLASEEEAAGKTTVPAATGNPLSAMILEGLRFDPQIGSVNALVTPGVGLFVMPDASPHPDDDPGRLISDPGVQTAGALTLTAGAVSTRIDVVEVQPTSTVVESDNRDLFNPSTGLFSAVLVNKVVRGSLTYRIRTGTAGAGFPGTASGWLPIAVCSVPSSATTWDDVVVWDVRPLLSDLARGPGIVDSVWNTLSRQHAAVVNNAGTWSASGIVEGELGGWKVGGNLSPTLTGATSVDLDSGATPNVQVPGFAAVASLPWYLYLVQPFGLPRWARYSPATSLQRTPQAPRGVPAFTQQAPDYSGRPTTAIPLPTATGLGNTSDNALAVLAGVFGAGATFCGIVVGRDAMTRILTPGISLAPSSGAASAVVTYQLTSALVPGHASVIRLRLTTVIADTAGDYTISRMIALYDAVGGNIVVEQRWNGTATVPAAGSFTDQFEVELPLPPPLPTGSFSTLEVKFTITWVSGGAIAYSNQAAAIVGWRIG